MKSTHTRQWVIFTLTTLLFIMSQFYRVSMAVITPHLERDLALTPQQLGTSSAVFFYAFALTQIPIGIYLDRIGARVTMTVLTLVGIGGALIFAFAQSFAVLLLGRTLMGIGMACNFMGSLKLITQWFSPARFATLTALTASIGTAGNVIAATPLVYLVQAVGWRSAFGLCAFFNLFLVIIFFLVVRNRPAEPALRFIETEPFRSLLSPFSGVMQLFRIRDYWIISLGTFCRYGAFAAVQALWAGPFLMQVMNYSQVLTGNILLLLNLGFILGGPFFGTLSDSLLRSRKKVIVPGVTGLAAILAILTILPEEAPLWVTALLFFGIGLFSSAGTIMYPHIKEFMPPELAGTAVTGINFFTMAGAAVFLQGLGTLMQWFYPQATMGRSAFMAAFGLCGSLLAAAMILYSLLTRETLKKQR